MQPRILLINPPIYDFAAYDFWLKPYGLLRIGGMLRGQAQLSLFDFLDRNSNLLSGVSTTSDEYGRGRYHHEPAPKPACLADVPRHYKRYGIPRVAFAEYLRSHEPFDFALVCGSMTYWYLGVAEVIQDLCRFSPHTQSILGGIYPALCPEHAARLGADLTLTTNDSTLLWKLIGLEPDLSQPPLWELYPRLSYGVLKLSTGCPFKCSYCAARLISPVFQPRPLSHVLREFALLLDLGVRDFAFYDDALLIHPEKALLPFLKEVRHHHVPVRFHTPNALHLRYLDERSAAALIEGGFKKIFLGVESRSPTWLAETGGKAHVEDLEHAFTALLKAGFDPLDVSAYMVLGHPKQSVADALDTLQWIHACGMRCMLAEFSPLPGTPDGELCRKWTDLNEPLCHNNTAFVLRRYGVENTNRIKTLAHHLNQNLTARTKSSLSYPPKISAHQEPSFFTASSPSS